jgi:hypothetical protein
MLLHSLTAKFGTRQKISAAQQLRQLSGDTTDVPNAAIGSAPLPRFGTRTTVIADADLAYCGRQQPTRWATPFGTIFQLLTLVAQRRGETT